MFSGSINSHDFKLDLPATVTLPKDTVSSKWMISASHLSGTPYMNRQIIHFIFKIGSI